MLFRSQQQPDYSVALNNLGLSFSSLGQYGLAIESLQRAIRISPDMVEAHYNLGHIYNKAGRDKLAIESYKQAILLKPDLAEAHNNLAFIYLNRGERGLALEHYSLLKSINYEMARKLFAAIFKDKLLNANSR